MVSLGRVQVSGMGICCRDYWPGQYHPRSGARLPPPRRCLPVPFLTSCSQLCRNSEPGLSHVTKGISAKCWSKSAHLRSSAGTPEEQRELGNGCLVMDFIGDTRLCSYASCEALFAGSLDPEGSLDGIVQKQLEEAKFRPRSDWMQSYIHAAVTQLLHTA